MVSAWYHDWPMTITNPSICPEPQVDDRRDPRGAPTFLSPAVGVGSLVFFGRCSERIGGPALTLKAFSR